MYIVAIQRTEPLWGGKVQGGSENTTVNKVLQQEQELAKQGKERQVEEKQRNIKHSNDMILSGLTWLAGREQGRVLEDATEEIARATLGKILIVTLKRLC